ncbi:MAG: hypothetical protein ACRECO_15765 [Xanthobacteraceae bacterium]
MTEAAPHKGRWAGLAIAVVAVSAVFSALLTYLIFAMPSADPPGTWPTPAQLVATWLMFTFLLSLMFGAGIWRMTGWNGGGASDISPMSALIALAATIGIVGFGAAAVPLFTYIDAKFILFGVLAIALVVGLLIVRPFKARGEVPPDGGTSA